jgi:hypothetical protein
VIPKTVENRMDGRDETWSAWSAVRCSKKNTNGISSCSEGLARQRLPWKDSGCAATSRGGCVEWELHSVFFNPRLFVV